MRSLLAAILFVSACTTTDAITDLGDFSGDAKADVQTIKVPLRLAAGESAEFALTADGPFQAKATYAQSSIVKIAAGAAVTQGVQPTLVVEGPRTPTELVLTVTNTGAAEIKGTFEIGAAAPSCSDDVWISWFDTLVAKLAATNGFIDSNEQSQIDGLLAGRPCASSSDGAFARWHQAFDAQLAATNGFIDNNEQVYVDILKAQRPAAESEAAYLEWAPKFITYVGSTSGFIDNNEKTYVDLRLAVMPKPAPSDLAYVGWATRFKPFLAGVNGFIDNNERDILNTLIAGKACGVGGPEAQAAWNELAAVASGDAQAVLEAARPTACP